MPQIFGREFNTISRFTIFGSLLILAFLWWVAEILYRSPYATGADTAYLQPVPFSHQHHVGQLGFDCRYCHTSVENSSFAGIPSTKICMNCHSQMWVGSEMLAPVRASYASGRSLEWQRVHNLPQFAYFDHSIHIHKGVGCVTCHGPVDEMPLTWQSGELTMAWCLNCHEDPAKNLRPREQVFNMKWKPAEEQADLGKQLAAEYRVKSRIDCSTCHR
jgi:Cytochrome c7 and related cytochrome c